eukprot:scaffold32685_cov43-Prasinocladus_malaysianus.AAC.3
MREHSVKGVEKPPYQEQLIQLVISKGFGLLECSRQAATRTCFADRLNLGIHERPAFKTCYPSIKTNIPP